MRNTALTYVLRAVQQTPWAILPEKLAKIRAFLVDRLSGKEVSANEQAELIKKAEERSRATRAGSVAVIPVFGTIAQRMNMFMAYSGGTSTEMLGKEILSSVADPDVSAIVLNVDSPGGSVSGLPELHALIMEARDKKPIVAVVNPLSASAAYWITSAASEISITDSGEAGSVGVFAMHVDESEALKMEGLAVTLISAGKFKTEGNPFEPLSDEAKEAIQEDVDAYYAMFIRDVAKGRGVSVKDVKEKYGQGRMLRSQEAKAAGMVDRIETLSEAIQRITRPPGRSRKAAQLHSQLDRAGRLL